jgi:hypothetical protein
MHICIGPFCFYRNLVGLAFLQRCCSTHDLQNLVGDGRLTRLVVGELQLLKHLCGVVCGLVHGGHTRTVLRSQTVQHTFVKLGFQRAWNKVEHDLFL